MSTIQLHVHATPYMVIYTPSYTHPSGNSLNLLLLVLQVLNVLSLVSEINKRIRVVMATRGHTLLHNNSINNTHTLVSPV